jgi:hypothetical protein
MLVRALGTSWDRGVGEAYLAGEALPRAPGRWVCLIALCVASLWEFGPPGNPQNEYTHVKGTGFFPGPQ